MSPLQRLGVLCALAGPLLAARGWLDTIVWPLTGAVLVAAGWEPADERAARRAAEEERAAAWRAAWFRFGRRCRPFRWLRSRLGRGSR